MSTFLVSSPSYCRQAADANAGWHGGLGMNSALNSSIELERFQAKACPDLIRVETGWRQENAPDQESGARFDSFETEGLWECPA
jgi:hypothetical protein